MGEVADAITPAASCISKAGYNPKGAAAALVLRTIESAHKSIRWAAYSFTSPDVVRSLISARRRGVDVSVVVDERGNHGAASIAALNLLANASIPVHTVSSYPIHHDKLTGTPWKQSVSTTPEQPDARTARTCWLSAHAQHSRNSI